MLSHATLEVSKSVHLVSVPRVVSCGANLEMTDDDVPLADAEDKKPHIIFVMVDDLGWNGLGFNGGNTEIKTPYIDALAKIGVILSNPTRTSFLAPPEQASSLEGRLATVFKRTTSE